VITDAKPAHTHGHKEYHKLHLLKNRRPVGDQMFHAVDDRISSHCWSDIRHHSLTSDRKFASDRDELLQNYATRHIHWLCLLAVNVSTSAAVSRKEIYTIIVGCDFFLSSATTGLFSYVRFWCGCWALRWSVTGGVSHKYSLGGDTMMPSGYTISFATHF